MKTNQLPIKKSFPYFLLNNLRIRNNLIIQHEVSDEVYEKIDFLLTEITKCENDKINNLFSGVEKYKDCVSIYLHGSWADDTKTSFSDLDDFVILDLKKLNQKGHLDQVVKILNRIDMKFCRLDPLQHHGHWIVSKEELNNYDNSFMPLHIMSDAKKIVGKNYIEASINKKISILGLKKNIRNTCIGIEKLSNLFFSGNINSYQLKALIGSFALMPAFIYQVEGENISKAEAIKKASNIYSDKALLCMQWSTLCRNNWSVVTNTKKFKRFTFMTNLFLNPHLWRRFSQKFSPVVTSEQLNLLTEQELHNTFVKEFITTSQIYAK